MDAELHRLLKRQIGKSNLDLLDTTDGKTLVESINKTYIQFEKERKILEESAQHMLKKIVESNENLHTIIESLDGFNYHVSHDLKNSMINTLSLSKMTRKYFKREDYRKVDEVVEKLVGTAEGGLSLVEKFLKISKFETRLLEEEEENMDIVSLINNAIRHLGLEEKVDFIVLEQDFTTLRGKELGFSSLFQNLVSNAYKYRKIGARPRLELRLTKIGNDKEIHLSDNGIGIDMKGNEEKLFKPFVRLSNVSEQEGTGIGLFLVKKVVVEHNGTIRVESKPGEGATFILKF